jgi:hypothetical protein
MENNQNQKQKVGAGILTLSIFQLVVSGFLSLSFLINIFMKDFLVAQYKTMGKAELPDIPNSTLIISLIIAIIIILGVVLILMKKKLGIYIYFAAIVVNRVYSIVDGGFDASVIVFLVVPVLMAIFIWQKKEVFGLGAKNENVSL